MKGKARWLVALALAGLSAAAQTTEPLRKTDLIRLLSGGALSHAEIAALIARNCLSFTPTARDRQDLTALGADSAIMTRIDACGRRASASATLASPPPTPTAPLTVVPLQSRVVADVGTDVIVAVALRQGTTGVPGVRLVLRGSGGLAGPGTADAEAVTDARGIAAFRVRPGTVARTVPLTVVAVAGQVLAGQTTVEFIARAVAAGPATPAPTVVPPGPPAPAPAARPSPARTGWVAGTGQRGVVGRRAAVPLVFEVRDSAGRPIPGVAVALSAVNGRLLSPPDRTDTAGALRVALEFGARAAPTTVTATVGSIVRQATLYPAVGPAARLVVLYGRDTVTRRLELAPDVPARLLVIPTDALGNPLPVRGLLAAAGDAGVVKVAGVSTDSLGGHVSLLPGRVGSSTNLAVQASGLRADLTATIARRP
jgi:hypothetical protein